MENANGAVIDDMPAEMDYREHERTYRGFISLVKLAIISMALLVIGLYSVVIAGNGWVGGILILASIIVPVAMSVMSRE